MRTVESLWAVIALKETGDEEGIAVYHDPTYGPMPLVASAEEILTNMAKLYTLQNPKGLYRLKRFDASALMLYRQ